MNNGKDLTKNEQKLVDEVLFSYDKALAKVEKGYNKKLDKITNQWLFIFFSTLIISFTLGFLSGGNYI